MTSREWQGTVRLQGESKRWSVRGLLSLDSCGGARFGHDDRVTFSEGIWEGIYEDPKGRKDNFHTL